MGKMLHNWMRTVPCAINYEPVSFGKVILCYHCTTRCFRRLLGIITKKDVLKHMREVEETPEPNFATSHTL